MKNKLLSGVVFSVVIAAPVLAFAQGRGEGRGYGDAGCGLGAMIIGPQPGIIQTVAATSNGILGSQTFGITSGTSNCDQWDGDRRGERRGELQRDFVAVNMDDLKQEAAAGDGEYLTAFATVLGCEAGAKATFLSTTQKHHDEIFAVGADADHVVANWKSVLHADATLATACKL